MRLAGHLGVRAPDAPLLRHLAGSADPVAQIALFAGLGFAGAADNYLVLRPAAEQVRIGAALRDHGLAMGSFVHDPLGWNLPRWSATDAEGRHALAAAFDISLAAAARSGGARITIVTGRDPGVAADRQRGAMVANLRAAGNRAAAAGVMLCVEPTHPAFAPGLLIERWPDALALVRAVDHPAVMLNLDLGHVALHGDDGVAAILACAPWTAMVQIADVPGRVEPGAGRLDWHAAGAALDRVGYDGLVELELEPAEPGEAGERAMLARLVGLGMLGGSVSVAP
jgi:hydroxypyruvate isomerase